MSQKILIIEDDDVLRASLASQLRETGKYAVTEAANGKEGGLEVSRGQYDGVILDIGLPDVDGRELCRYWRKSGINIPVIMLTARSGDSDIIAGFESGSNDYVVKPFRVAVLLARLEARIRTFERDENAELAVGPYRLQIRQRQLVHRETGKKTHLTDKETAILRYLFRASGEPVSKEELLTNVWGYRSNIITHTLETHIYRLRRKLEPDDHSPRLLITGQGGYRLLRNSWVSS